MGFFSDVGRKVEAVKQSVTGPDQVFRCEECGATFETAHDYCPECGETTVTEVTTAD